MLAILGKPPTGDGWAVEWKFDGQRGLIVIDDGVTVYSRNGADVTRTFPELSSEVPAAVAGRRVVLDGEIVALDAGGRPCFQRLQQRWPQQRRPSPALLHQVPVTFIAFDVLAADGTDVTGRPYLERRGILENLLVEKSKRIVVPRFWAGDLSSEHMLTLAAEHRMEGIVAKRLDSIYRPGRSDSWVKCPVRSTAEVIVVGWWPAGGPNGPNSVGALLLAGHDVNGQLTAVGHVGTGFSAVARRRLFDQLVRIERKASPLSANSSRQWKGVRWVHPHYVGEVEYREYLRAYGLRHTSWKGLRDVDPKTVSAPIANPSAPP